MKVAELIEALKALPQDLEVETEGCDCVGDVSRVTLTPARYHGLDQNGEPRQVKAATVMLERSNGS